MTSSTRASASSGVVLGGRRSCGQAGCRAAKFKQAGMRCKPGLHNMSYSPHQARCKPGLHNMSYSPHQARCMPAPFAG